MKNILIGLFTFSTVAFAAQNEVVIKSDLQTIKSIYILAEDSSSPISLSDACDRYPEYCETKENQEHSEQKVNEIESDDFIYNGITAHESYDYSGADTHLSFSGRNLFSKNKARLNMREGYYDFRYSNGKDALLSFGTTHLDSGVQFGLSGRLKEKNIQIKLLGGIAFINDPKNVVSAYGQFTSMDANYTNDKKVEMNACADKLLGLRSLNHISSQNILVELRVAGGVVECETSKLDDNGNIVSTETEKGVATYKLSLELSKLSKDKRFLVQGAIDLRKSKSKTLSKETNTNVALRIAVGYNFSAP